MPNVSFDYKISLGNALSIATMVIGLTIGWQTLAGETSTNSRDIIQVNKRIDAIDASLQGVIREIQADRLSQTRILTELASDMRYLRTAVDEIREGR